MKKLVFFITLLLSLLLLTACDDGPDHVEQGPGQKPSCTHVWVVTQLPDEGSLGGAECSLCQHSTNIPELSTSAYTITEGNDETIYTYTPSSGGTITFSLPHFIFEACDGGYRLVRYAGNKANVVVPATYQGEPVVELHSYDVGPLFDSSVITSVTIPDSVTKISGYIFSRNCTSVESITFPAVGDDIGGRYGLPEMFPGIFNSLTTATVTKGTLLDSYFFNNCPNLETVYLPADLEHIGYQAFGECESLESVYFGGTLADWCQVTFDEYYLSCHPLSSAESLYFKDENGEYYEIGDVLVIPEGVTQINDKAFFNFPMEVLILPDSVTDIGDEAFAECRNLTAVVIGSGVNAIGKKGFYECTALTTVYYKGTASEWGRVSVDNSNGSSNYFVREATKYYYSEEGDVFAYADGNDLWHFDSENMPVLWSFNLTSTLAGKTYIHSATNVTVSDEYWSMLEAAEAANMLEYVLDADMLFMYENSQDKNEFQEKLSVHYGNMFVDSFYTFTEDTVTETVGDTSSFPASYIEVDGREVFLTSNELLLFTIRDGQLHFDRTVDPSTFSVESIYILQD